MNRLLNILLLITLFSSFAVKGQENGYRIKMNLENVERDRLKITIHTPKVTQNEVEYIMPAVIPGSYSKKDYGRFIERFRAYDKKGKKLKSVRKSVNVFKIKKASKLDRIEYIINDTWDDNSGNYIFQPGGTNIEKGKNVVINHHGFYGYLEGYKMLPYRLEIQKPAQFYGGTPLKRLESKEKKDLFYAPNYVNLADNPILYAKPDTTSFMAGNTRVHFMVYSETGIVTAKEVQQWVRPLSKALADFFVTMPVDEYHFIMYFPENSPLNPIFQNGSYGALEHSYCSLYFLPEMRDKNRLKDIVVSVASHEFLHILTPLNIHSEEIGDFNFRNPEMSAHLWLYEGITEYFSNLVQIQAGMMDKIWFMDEMQTKIQTDFTFEPVSFTKMSREILKSPYQEMYLNVYNKGAMIGFLLDIRLNELSGGKMDLRQLMMDLSKKYGPNKPFKDDKLIEEITQMTYPEIGEFFKKYVQGDQPLPYTEYLAKIGWNYLPQANVESYFYGNFGFGYATNLNVFYLRKAGRNVFGLRENDVLLSINGTELQQENANDLLRPLVDAEKNEKITIKFRRNGEEKTVTARPESKLSKQEHVIQEMAKPSEEKLKLRVMILGKESL